MSSEKIRAEFEAAYAKKFPRRVLAWSDRNRSYTFEHASGAWWAWQTATPRSFGDGWCAAKGLDMDEARIDRIAASHGDGEHYSELNK